MIQGKEANKLFLGNRIKEGQGLHSGPEAKPTVQSRNPDFAYSHATMNIDFYRKNLGCAITAMGGGEKRKYLLVRIFKSFFC